MRGGGGGPRPLRPARNIARLRPLGRIRHSPSREGRRPCDLRRLCSRMAGARQCRGDRQARGDLGADAPGLGPGRSRCSARCSPTCSYPAPIALQMDWFNELQRRTLTPDNALAADLCLCRRRHLALAASGCMFRRSSCTPAATASHRFRKAWKSPERSPAPVSSSWTAPTTSCLPRSRRSAVSSPRHRHLQTTRFRRGPWFRSTRGPGGRRRSCAPISVYAGAGDGGPAPRGRAGAGRSFARRRPPRLCARTEGRS